MLSSRQYATWTAHGMSILRESGFRSAPRVGAKRFPLRNGGQLEVDVHCDFLGSSCMTMAVAIRGPVSARFYKTFHAWSRLGSVSHQQRRCFVHTSPVCEADRAGPANWRQDAQHVRTSETQDRQDGPEPEKPQNIGKGKHRSKVSIYERSFALMQQHPTFLDRMQAEVNVKLTPAEHPSEQGRRYIYIESPSSHVAKYVRILLMRNYADMQALDDTVFYGHSRERPGVVKSNLNVSYEGAHLLKDKDEELKLRIEKAFSVGLALRREGTRNLVSITGVHGDVIRAKDFINSIELDPTKPAQPQADQLKEPLAKSSTTSSIPIPPAQSRPQSTPQPTPQPAAKKQRTPQTLKDVYKATMRSVPSSVVVLTTRVPSAQSGIDSLRGMTVSSLSSITLEPEPIISFSIRGPSRTLDCIIAGQSFTVNFLKSGATAARIADIFSKPYDDPSQPFRTVLASGWADVYESDDPTSPAMKASQIPARFTCELLPGKSLEVGDHTVVFAKVTHIWRTAEAMDPNYKNTWLAYAQATYRSVQKNPIVLTDLKPLERAQPIKLTPNPDSGSQISEDDQHNRRIRIDGIPRTATFKEVADYLKNAGLHAKRLKTILGDGQNPSYLFATFLTVGGADRAMRTLDGAILMGHTLKTTRVTKNIPSAAPQAPQPEVTTGEEQSLDESSSAELASIEPAFSELASDELSSTDSTSNGSGDGDVVDAYWRMALEDDIEDDVLEEHAADQRALGEAQKPADHPAANTEGNKQDK